MIAQPKAPRPQAPRPTTGGVLAVRHMERGLFRNDLNLDARNRLAVVGYTPERRRDVLAGRLGVAARASAEGAGMLAISRFCSQQNAKRAERASTQISGGQWQQLATPKKARPILYLHTQALHRLRLLSLFSATSPLINTSFLLQCDSVTKMASSTKSCRQLTAHCAFPPAYPDQADSCSNRRAPTLPTLLTKHITSFLPTTGVLSHSLPQPQQCAYYAHSSSHMSHVLSHFLP